jgi:EamA-like transporter family
VRSQFCIYEHEGAHCQCETGANAGEDQTRRAGRDHVTRDARAVDAATTFKRVAGLVGSPRPRLSTVALGLGLGAVSYGASLVLFVLALRGLGAARAGAYFALAPYFGVAGAVLVLDEPLTPRLAVAGALMAAAVWLLAREAHGHWHEHAPGVHAHRHMHDAHHQHAHQGWEGLEPHVHPHPTGPLAHAHPHRPDIHHGHDHDSDGAYV